jgi:hypothetical protein
MIRGHRPPYFWATFCGIYLRVYSSGNNGGYFLQFLVFGSFLSAALTVFLFPNTAKFITIGAGFDVDQYVGGKAVWLMKTLKTASI